MARQLILQNLMKLAQGIGANPKNFMGTRTNITFLGKGPTKNPLFQGPIGGFEGASEAQLGSRETIIEAVEDAMGFASANKLNSIQIRALELNLESLNKIYNPPVLPSASVTPIAPGIEGLRRFPKETHKFMGRPLKDKDFAEIDRLVAEGKIPAAPEVSPTSAMMEGLTGSEIAEKTHSARATLLRLLDLTPTGKEGVGITLREVLSPQELKWVLEGGGGAKGDPIALIAKYFGPAVAKNIPSKGTPEVIETFITKIMRLKDRGGRGVEDPFFSRTEIDFAGGGLAHILQVPRTGYSKGRMVKGALAILNRNKKNAEYMFKASDNVSPGYAQGDMKYNAQLLADQLAEDAGVLYEDLGALEQTKFYGTAYEYLAKEMGMMKKIMGRSKSIIPKNEAADWKTDFNEEILGETVKRVRPRQALHQWNPPKGRKPNASGGLAGILEV